jgi:hypothetical protein
MQTTIESLPIHLLHLIGQGLAPNAIELEPWSDGATCAAAAAACVIASKTTRHIGMEAYRALLGDAHPDVSVFPEKLTEKSTVKHLRDALAKWRLVKSGNKADLWSRLKQHHSPHCPVPSSGNLRRSLRTRAPSEDYFLRDDVGRCGQRIVDIHAKSMQLHGSVAGWRTAYEDRKKEDKFYAVHCQPFYDQEVTRYVSDWEDEEDDYWRGNGGNYWRSRERYRDGYEDSGEELEAVTATAREVAKPIALERWVQATGGLRSAASNAFISTSLRKAFLTKLVEKTMDDWATSLTTCMWIAPFLSVQQVDKEIRARLQSTRGSVGTLDQLDAAFSPERFEGLREEVSAMSERLKEACERLTAAYNEIPRGGPDPHPSMTELFPSIAIVFEVDGRLVSGDPDAVLPLFNQLVKKKKDELERQKAAQKVLEELRRQLVLDLKTDLDGKSIRCAMCPGKSRTFGKKCLRDHARSKHNLFANA